MDDEFVKDMLELLINKFDPDVVVSLLNDYLCENCEYYGIDQERFTKIQKLLSQVAYELQFRNRS